MRADDQAHNFRNINIFYNNPGENSFFTSFGNVRFNSISVSILAKCSKKVKQVLLFLLHSLYMFDEGFFIYLLKQHYFRTFAQTHR